MRIFAFIFVVLSAVFTAQTWASGWDTISINQNPVPAEALVSFSIGYPKDWNVYENLAVARQDNYNDIAYSQPGYGAICSFTPIDKGATLKSFNCKSYAVWPSRGSSAKEAMESFLSSKTGESRDRVKTSAEDSGWLVETRGIIKFHPIVLTNSVDLLKLEKDNSKSEIIPVIYHDFFFRSENSYG